VIARHEHVALNLYVKQTAGDHLHGPVQC